MIAPSGYYLTRIIFFPSIQYYTCEFPALSAANSPLFSPTIQSIHPADAAP